MKIIENIVLRTPDGKARFDASPDVVKEDGTGPEMNQAYLMVSVFFF